MSENVLLAVTLVGVGIVLALALVAFALRSPAETDGHDLDGQAASVGMTIGMLLGAGLGTVVWLSTGQFVFWVVFMGAGMTVGLAIGSSRSSGTH